MSRFFRSSDTESDSDSSTDNDSQYSQSDSEYDSDAESYHSEVEEDQPKNRFLKGGSDSEDSDDESNKKRQAKSQKDKRVEEMETAVKAIENGQKNNDWNLISTGKYKYRKVFFSRDTYQYVYRIRQIDCYYLKSYYWFQCYLYAQVLYQDHG
jgi:hypothetical protein